MFHGDALARRVHGEHAAGLAFVTARDHADFIILANGDAVPGGYLLFSHGSLPNLFTEIRYQTSGASETILAKFFSRSSRATGPKTRVPTGSLASLISTAALSSKRI